MRRKDCDIECTRELVDEVAKQLATRSMRDSDLPEVEGIQESDSVAIVQEGVNKRVGLKALAQFLGETFGLDELIEEIEKKLDEFGVQTGDSDYWDHSHIIPDEGQIIVYLDYRSKEVDGRTVYIPGVKIGTGNAYVQDLAFIDEGVAADLMAHITDSEVHVTQFERNKWNNKLNVDDASEVVDGALIFNRN